MSAPDITQQPTLFVVPYAHLDTQWRWEFPQVISEYLLKTMRVNFDYIDKYPHYVFNWTGANRYRLMKEYYPADYARLKQYVATGNWFPAGSSVEEGDVNLPSAESIIRQILYGNTYFRKDFGKASAEYMLPDCFGFPASLAQHPGARRRERILHAEAQRGVAAGAQGGRPGFAGANAGRHSVQRWRLGGARRRKGARGAESGRIWQQRSRLTSARRHLRHGHRHKAGAACEPETDWPSASISMAKSTGVFADYHYVGTGDIGGAADEESVQAAGSHRDTGRGGDCLRRRGGFGQPLTGTRHRRHAGAHGRWAGARDLFGRRSDVSRHQARDDRRACRVTRAIWS